MRLSSSGSSKIFLWLSVGCLVIGTGCEIRQREGEAVSETVAVAVETAPSDSPSPEGGLQSAAPTSSAIASPQPDFYKQGLNQASSAFNISQSASSADDWQLVARRWQQAIDLMKSVPAGHSSYATAQAKVTEYQRNLSYAQAKAQDTRVEVVINNQQKRAFRAKIVGRAGGTPVVLVAFNGNKVFPMIVDTGASDTVITEEMATALNVVPIGSSIARVADGRIVELPVGQVNSANVAGAQAQNLEVSIAPAGMDIGLLGNNFFSQYNVTFEQDWVVFRER